MEGAVGSFALQAILSHGLPPWANLHTEELAKKCPLQKYLLALLNKLDSDQTDSYLNGALCVGATLDFLRSTKKPESMIDGFTKTMRSKVNKYKGKTQTTEMRLLQKFVGIVHRLMVGGDATASAEWVDEVCPLPLP